MFSLAHNILDNADRNNKRADKAIADEFLRVEDQDMPRQALRLL
jgi:hypothetical protein